MKIRYILNNYQMGAKLKSSPTDKIVSQDRVDSKKVAVVFDLNDREIAFCDKLFAKKGQEV